MNRSRKIPVSCNKDCGAGCPLTAHIQENTIIQITDSPLRDTHMKGCLKGYRAMETLYHKDRLTDPLIRTGSRGSGQFRKAAWGEALDLISQKLLTLKDNKNCSGLMRIGGTGSCRGSLHNTDFVTKRFLALFGDYTETKGNYSSEASSFVKKPIFGTSHVGVDSETLLHSDKIILWGFNPSDTRYDCKVESVLKEAAQRGIPITVIDPRKTRTVTNLNAQWIPLKPGSDSALMLAILHVLIVKDLLNRSFIETYSSGFEAFEEYISGKIDGIEKSPSWAAEICGLTEERIETFAREYASAPVAALLPGLSLQRAISGENLDRMGAVLQLATGNTGRLGGSTGSSRWNSLEKPCLGQLPVPENPLVKSVPVYLWADAVLKGTKGGYPSNIQFIYNVGGNLIGQGSDRQKTVRAFEQAEFSVTHDYFMTETAKYSDIVLPVTTFLEREDLINSWDNYIFYSAKAAEPVGQSKNDFEIFSSLAERLGFGELYSENKSERQWLEEFLAQSEIPNHDEFKKKGFYSADNHLRVGLSKFIADPLKNPLRTKSGKIEISSEEFRKMGGTLLPKMVKFQTTGKYPLRLVTPHDKYRIHSQNDNILSLKKLCDDRLWISREDADVRNISNGEAVNLKSEEGLIGTTAFVTDKICPGAVSLTQGSWSSNVNNLTSTNPTKPSMGSRTHSVIVEVLKLN